MGILVAAAEAETVVELLGGLASVQAAPDAPTARLAFDAVKHQVVLIDLSLPGAKDGVELIEWLRARADPAVVVFGQQADSALLQRVGAARVDGYLMGPLQPEPLRACLRVLMARGQGRQDEDEDLPVLSSHQLQQVERYLNENLSGPVSLETMGRELEMSRGHFSRLFKATTGLTPHAFLTARRMERAQRLLRETELPIGDVAAEVGFESQGHFATVFKRSTGRRPRDFRRDALRESGRVRGGRSV